MDGDFFDTLRPHITVFSVICGLLSALRGLFMIPPSRLQFSQPNLAVPPHAPERTRDAVGRITSGHRAEHHRQGEGPDGLYAVNLRKDKGDRDADKHHENWC